MTKHYARLYGDGSFNVCPADKDLMRARHELESSKDDDDTELVEIDVDIVKIFGPKKAKTFEDNFNEDHLCPKCKEQPK